MDCSVLLLSIYTPLKRGMCAHNNYELPIVHGQLYLLLINILLGSFQLFLHSDQPLSEVK